MKNFLLTGLLLLIGLSTFAQINTADSTAQVIGYWGKGEKQKYLISYDKLQLSGDDTTRKENAKYEVEISILDSTANSYIIEWNYRNFNVAKINMLTKDVTDIIRDMSVVFKTDEFGSFIEIINLEEIRDLLKEALELTKNSIPANSEVLNVWDETVSKFLTKQAIEGLALQDIQQFYTFHGGSYKLGEVLKGIVEVPNVLGNEPLHSDMTVTLQGIYVEDNYFTLNAYQEVNQEQLIETTFNFLTATAKNLGVDPPRRDDFNNLTNVIDVSSSIDGFGWVLYSVQSKTVRSNEETVFEDRSIELL